MTNKEKIDLGLCIAQTDSLTGEVTLIPYSDEEIERLNNLIGETNGIN